jgi:hypothetical protein
MKKNNFKKQKGISIYLALLLIAIFLDLSMGLSFILFGEILTMRDIDHSVVAFYAADSGIEKIFYLDNIECYPVTPAPCLYASCAGYPDNCKGLKSPYVTGLQYLDNNSFYQASFATNAAGERIATSTGFYEKTLRSLEGRY